MCVAADQTPFAARHQQHLGVGFEPHHTVDHLRANVFEFFSPVDVGFFVKARFELHDHRHFFAALHGLAQQVHQS
ncbi:hypothetical protein GALL_477450 [mine drainage metagenome]|uniref:Uncharacterized protein n=1 Tax=mine drainage metagenome TaxID=410659 RepID=A0A1J5PIM2_9ZZZZ